MTGDLFNNAASCFQLDLPGADIVYYPCFIEAAKADDLFQSLFDDIQWQEESISVYGKQYPVPRLSAWYADNRLSYEYSGLKKEGLPWVPVLHSLREQLKTVTSTPFNSVLANLYRDGNDGVGWHADDEPELGMNPVIASLSFGQERTFQLKHKKDNNLKQSIVLEHGSLLLMAGATQHNWQHQIPKSKKIKRARINLTFRQIL